MGAPADGRSDNRWKSPSTARPIPQQTSAMARSCRDASSDALTSALSPAGARRAIRIDMMRGSAIHIDGGRCQSPTGVMQKLKRLAFILNGGKSDADTPLSAGTTREWRLLVRLERCGHRIGPDATLGRIQAGRFEPDRRHRALKSNTFRFSSIRLG